MKRKSTHKFEVPVIAEGVKEILQTCLTPGCGLVRVKYKGGAIAYINENGKRVPIAPKKCIEEEIAQPVKMIPIRGNVDNGIDLKARFTECLVMLRCATDELDPGRVKLMCETFLLSREYKEIIRAIVI